MTTLRTIKIEELDYIELKDAEVATADDEYMLEEFQGTGEILENSIGSNHLTMGMMEYLNLAYNNHKGVYITPEQIWLIVLSEIATIVSNAPEQYEDVFTSSKGEKQDILVRGSGHTLPMDEIKKALIEIIPSEISTFFPQLETFDENYATASSIAFADVVSPYYSYSMYMCGIPEVRVVGTNSDWNNIVTCVDTISQLLNTSDITNYLDKVIAVINVFIFNVNPSFWKKMFYVERCGSGGQVEVLGWFRDMYNEVPSIKYTHNYPTGISSIQYKNITTNEKFEMYSGLMSCSLEDDGFLRPNIDKIVVKLVED